MNTFPVVSGNLIDAYRNGEVNYIFHCCNCQQSFGSGIAKEIKERIPEAFEEDVAHTEYCRERGWDVLGTFTVTENECVVNLYGQEFYHKFGDYYKENGRQLHYGAYTKALCNALAYLREIYTPSSKLVLGFPYGIGSVRAGGDWNIVREITEALVERAGMTMVWYKLD